MGTHLRRVSDDFWNEVMKIHRKNRGLIPKTSITKQIAAEIRAKNKKQPRYEVNYWPLSRKKVKIY